jgi:hypothetical protein
MAESSQQRSAGPVRLSAMLFNPFTRASSVYSQNPNLSTVNGPSTTPRISFRGPFGWRRPSPSVAAPPSPPPLPDWPARTWTEPAARTPPVAQVPDAWPRLSPPRGPLPHRPVTMLTPPESAETLDSAPTELERRRKREREERRRRKRRHHQQRGWVRGGRRNANHRHSRHYSSYHRASANQGIKLAGFAATIFLLATVAACEYLSPV